MRQQLDRLVGDAELVFQLSRRRAVGVRRHHVRGPEPRRQRQFPPMHGRARGQRGLPARNRCINEHPALLICDGDMHRARRRFARSRHALQGSNRCSGKRQRPFRAKTIRGRFARTVA